MTASTLEGTATPSDAQIAKRSAPNLWLGLRRGAYRACPACGEGKLFCGYLTMIPTCSVCANDNKQYPPTISHRTLPCSWYCI
ncbi:hypothetical protein ACFQS7_25610 [Dankookia sp. GCM10030260]|uniref:hypothetical protein n=1 Tax=Dankookia sp. GCM10030260 TaxID=3273390 RepID=UPI00361504A0